MVPLSVEFCKGRKAMVPVFCLETTVILNGAITQHEDSMNKNRAIYDRR